MTTSSEGSFWQLDSTTAQQGGCNDEEESKSRAVTAVVQAESRTLAGTKRCHNINACWFVFVGAG
jgi:hypothetical protein